MISTRLNSKPEAEWVGTYVYPPFRTDRIGKVLKVEVKQIDDFPGVKTRKQEVATVQWADAVGLGQSEHPVASLQMIDALIADHEQKLKTHKDRLKKAKKVLDG